MEADPGEQNNLQAKHPEIVDKLTRLLFKQVNDGRSTPGKLRANDVPVDVWKRPDLLTLRSCRSPEPDGIGSSRSRPGAM